MSLLAAIFGVGVEVRNALYDRQLLKSRRLSGPVVSIGNLSTGGSGKTPFVILLGELLKARGVSFDVLSRGYGRKTKGVRVVEPGGSARDFGDEPLLIARRLEVPVIVGQDRYAARRRSRLSRPPRLHQAGRPRASATARAQRRPGIRHHGKGRGESGRAALRA